MVIHSEGYVNHNYDSLMQHMASDYFDNSPVLQEPIWNASIFWKALKIFRMENQQIAEPGDIGQTCRWKRCCWIDVCLRTVDICLFCKNYSSNPYPIFKQPFELTVVTPCGKVVTNSISVCKGCDEERTRQAAFQRAGGWCEPVMPDLWSSAFRAGSPKGLYRVDVSRVCYVSA